VIVALALVLAGAMAAATVWAAGLGGLAYGAIYLAALVPGLPIGFRVFGRRHAAGWIVGAALGYFLTALALWAAIALGLPSVLTFVAAWIVLALVAFLAVRRGGAPLIALEPWTRRDTGALLLVLLLVPAIAGVPFARLGAKDAEGNRYYRAYFTADFVWHMAVTAEMKKFAMPPRNMFMPQRPLHYYWAYYLLPAAVAGTQTGPLADVENDLKVNALGTALLFVASIFVAAWAAVPRAAAVGWGVALAIVASSAEGAVALWRILRRGAPLGALRDLNVDAVSNWWFGGLRVDGLPRCFWWVPQHTSAYILGLGAIAMAAAGGSAAPLEAHVIAGLALAGSVAFNPFVGAMFTVAWGLAMTVDAFRSRDRVFGRILRCAAAAGPVALALAWSVWNQMPGSAPSLVEFGLRGGAGHAPVWNLLLSLGPALVPAALGVALVRRVRGRASIVPAAVLAIVALLVMHLVRLQVDDSWVGFRGGQIFLAAVPALIACALAADGWRRVGTAVVLAAFLVGTPTTIVDVYNAQDISNLSPGPGFPWTQVLDRPHVEALTWLKRATPADAVVQADPTSRGETTWTIVSSFGERRMAASLPRTLVKEPEYAQRSESVRRMYATSDAREASAIAHSLRIDYIWVDEVERRAYPAGAAKFDASPELFAPAFRNSEVTIYRVQ